jgi:GcrA cell cycle regulator
MALTSDFWHDGDIGEARRDHLLVLHAEGCSLGLIAERLGTTRNAISGKCHRLRLEMYPIPAMSKTRAFVRPHQQNIPVKRGPPPKPVPTGAYQCTLLDLKNKSCRYPLWSDASLPVDQKFYCGVPHADISSGRPYCSVHAERCLTTPKKKNAPG